MGNSCGCVDPAEKDAEVKVENRTQNNAHRTNQITNYRDSTLSKNYGQKGTPATSSAGPGEIPQLFSTEDPYLLELQ